MSSPALYEGGSKVNPVQITEDEAAVYDRQIRLWGLDAQQRMRNATILIVRLRGTATEAIKNIVLAGIGKLVLIDPDDVSEEDLGAGFFFREEDVGKKVCTSYLFAGMTYVHCNPRCDAYVYPSKKVDVARARIESLNPLVAVQTMKHHTLLERESLDALVMSVDLICPARCGQLTPVAMEIEINEVCRRFGKPFYAGGTFGLLGYIFCDLLKHDYIAPDRSAQGDAPRSVKATQVYSPLHMALRHRWSALTKRQTKELNPGVVLTILALWQYQKIHQGELPASSDATPELLAIANAILAEAEVNVQVLSTMPSELIESISMSATHEFSPVCAVVGGMLAQDILKALAAREAPIANFFVFDGNTGSGSVARMNM
ncbi:hypothetical protein ID866_1432 [Astraeus odoratus]|nr:hypothetical protein ID866_1432 [Astraeus odoratus]